MTVTIPNAPGPLSMPPASAGIAADAGFLVRWLTLGAAAGGVAGLLVGGVGGRLAMFVLRLTSPDHVIGIQSDDGFRIGAISTSTFVLLVITAAIGALGGIAYVSLRGFLPARLRVAVWTATSGVVGGAVIIHPDGVDFRLLEPAWLACALFITIPAGGGALTAWLAERWSQWWWTRRARSLSAGIIALPLVFVVPLLATLAVAIAATAAAGRVPFLRGGATARWSRVLAVATATIITAAASRALIGDLRAIL